MALQKRFSLRSMLQACGMDYVGCNESGSSMMPRSVLQYADKL
jgi:hypothetical protein